MRLVTSYFIFAILLKCGVSWTVPCYRCHKMACGVILYLYYDVANCVWSKGCKTYKGVDGQGCARLRQSKLQGLGSSSSSSSHHEQTCPRCESDAVFQWQSVDCGSAEPLVDMICAPGIAAVGLAARRALPFAPALRALLVVALRFHVQSRRQSRRFRRCLRM